MWSTHDGRVLALEASAVALVAAAVTVSTLAHSNGPALAGVGVALAHVVVAGTAWVLHSVGHLVALARLWLPILLLLGVGVWTSDAHVAALGPLYALVLAWLAMRCPPRDIFVAVPVAVASYAGGLLAAGAPTHVVGSTLVLVPTCVTVSLLISTMVQTQGRLRRELESRDQWRAALMATLAHDVRSPLSTVAGTLEILQEDPEVPERFGRLVNAASRQTTRVLALANQLLDVERIQDGRLVMDLAMRALAPIAEQVADLTDPAKVQVNVDPALTAAVDQHRIEQVLYNLVINALRHGEPPVVISARSDLHGVQIVVEDHGGGVPAGAIPRLFDRFSSSDRSPDSVGLGLWIVRTLVVAHGGSVRYESARHGGARFVLLLPPKPASQSQRSVNGQTDEVLASPPLSMT